MVVLQSPRAAAIHKQLREAAQRTKYEQYLDDTYELLTILRPAGTWDSGVEDERYATAGSGRCKLYGSGTGGPRISDIVYPESPYRLRALTSEFIEGTGLVPSYVGALIIVNGKRVFTLDDVKVEDAADTLVDVYVTERIGMKPEEILR